jgi:hypothetical protein
LANGKDSIYRWVLNQPTSSTVKHKIEETSEKSGETTRKGKALKLVAIYLTFR